MRRLFHGRMITVDGHMRRMESNYNQYAIVNDTKEGYQLENKKRSIGTAGTELVWEYANNRITTIVPVKANKTYTASATENGFACYFGGVYNSNLILQEYDASDWLPSVEFTAPIDGYAYLSVRNATAPTTDIPVGSCGIIVEEE